MKNLAHAIRYCWRAYKQARREYFAPLLMLWNGFIERRHFQAATARPASW